MSFLHDYFTYATGNEAPDMFHVWSGYACLSAAIKRKTWLPFEDTAIYPNIYVMLVGDAGNGKSWAMKKAKRLMAKLDIHTSGSVETPQGLWRFMCGNKQAQPDPIPPACCYPAKWPDGVLRDTHCITIVANEFINFISLQEKEWINALNDIYDEDHYHYRTKNGGEDSIIGPYVTMLGALTTEVSNDLQKTRIISTGLARRTLFQYGERKWFEPHPHPTFKQGQQEARDRCIEHLKGLEKVAGPFVLAPDVDEWWAKWYNPHLATVPKKSPQTKSWFASKSIQVQKLAMLTSLSESSNLLLEIKHFELALSYLGELEKDLFKIFGGSGRNELAGIGVKITEYLNSRQEPVFWKEVYMHSFHMFDKRDTMKDFEATITHLMDSNQIRCIQVELRSDKGIVLPPQRFIGTIEGVEAYVKKHGPQPPPSGSPQSV